ncbi:MAG: SDR family NAD(P)-dependent oxidoreductase [Dehalococcoidia bacterium]|nr:SDR family NAD(P)-dependent oxidoreductase [Dehalococcoidia bacterium]
MRGRVCLVTGASSGLGRATARALARLGADLILVSRDGPRAAEATCAVEQDATGRVELLPDDFSSMDDVKRLAAEVRRRYRRLDVLINNAGVLRIERSLTADGFETTFAVNHLAHFLLTNLLLDLLETSAPSRIVNVSSSAHYRGAIDFDDPSLAGGYSPMRAYSQSKLANVLFTKELARRMGTPALTANAVHPGLVRTGFGRDNRGIKGTLARVFMAAQSPFMIGPEAGADTIVYLAASPAVEGISGEYFVKRAVVEPSELALDADAAARLWEMSARLTGVADHRP